MVVLVAVIGATVVVARQQPLHPALAVLHLDLCEPPCWIGITPGVTTIKDALYQIGIVYPSSAYNVVIDESTAFIGVTIFKGNIPIGLITFYIDEQTIRTIEFNFQHWDEFPGTQTTYADIYRVFGTPTRFRLVHRSIVDTDMFYVRTQGFISAISWEQELRLPYRTIRYLIFEEANDPSRFNTFDFVEWRGFHSVSRYLQFLCIEQGCD